MVCKGKSMCEALSENWDKLNINDILETTGVYWYVNMVSRR